MTFSDTLVSNPAVLKIISRQFGGFNFPFLLAACPYGCLTCQLVNDVAECLTCDTQHYVNALVPSSDCLCKYSSVAYLRSSPDNVL